MALLRTDRGPATELRAFPFVSLLFMKKFVTYSLVFHVSMW